MLRTHCYVSPSPSPSLSRWRAGYLQHTATHYNTLQHTATHCSKHIATYCNGMGVYISSAMARTKEAPFASKCTLQRTATHRNTPQRIATYCHTLQRNTTHCSTLQQTDCNTLQLKCISDGKDKGSTFRVEIHTATHCDTL